jgi:transcription termination factor Rho
MDDVAASEFLLERLQQTKTNEDFFASMKRK